ncbi:MAG: hypothetical protein FJ102_06085, partial [Deltaproteobacteria bacterium]|nr:hypothetical protein [Deltaproteobacteria bacterium]
MLALHLPAFRLERCGHDPAAAVVLVEFARSADRVLACTPPVARAGVVPGMALAEARALCPELRVERREGEGERGDLESLRDMLLRFSPAVAAVFPDGLLVDVAPAAARPVIDWLSRLGHAVQAAWAPDAWAAILLSRAAPHAAPREDLGQRGQSRAAPHAAPREDLGQRGQSRAA